MIDHIGKQLNKFPNFSGHPVPTTIISILREKVPACVKSTNMQMLQGDPLFLCASIDYLKKNLYYVNFKLMADAKIIKSKKFLLFSGWVIRNIFHNQVVQN